MSVLKKLASDTALYGLSSILGRVLNYLLVPLYTSRIYGFTTAEFGVFTKLYAYVAFLNIIYTYGMETTFFRYAKKENFQQTYNLILTQIILSTSFFTALIIIFASSIAAFLEIPQHADFVIYLALIMGIDAIIAIPFARLRFENKAKTFAFIKIANILLTIFLNIFFLVICKEIYQGNWFSALKPLIGTFYQPEIGIGYIIIANLLANACLFPLLIKCFLDFRFQWNWTLYKPMLQYAYPLIFLGLAGMVNNMIDKILLEYWLPDNFYAGKTSLQVIGIYGACFKLSVFMMLAIQAFKYAAEPFFFAQAENKKAPELFARVMHYFIIACVLIWVGVCLNLGILMRIFIPNPAYHEGIIVVPFLLLANLFLGIYYNLTVWFKLTDKTQYGTWISLTGALITVAGNYFLIPVLGYLGCALSTLLAYFTMAGLCYYYGNKFYPIPYQLKSAFAHIGLGAVLIGISSYFLLENWLISLVFNLVLLSIYLIFIYWTEKRNFKPKQAKLKPF